jgi:hypothetical protein
MVFIAVSLFSTVAYAADTATKISLDDRTKLSVSLQSNSLVFSNEPKFETYDNVRITIVGQKSDTLTFTYNRGQVNGATIT